MTREEAINLLGCIYTEVSTEEDREAIDKAIEALKAQKRGEWVKYKDENGYTKFMCSNCRFTRGRDKPKYCPNCGSNNRGAKHDKL